KEIVDRPKTDQRARFGHEAENIEIKGRHRLGVEKQRHGATNRIAAEGSSRFHLIEHPQCCFHAASMAENLSKTSRATLRSGMTMYRRTPANWPGHPNA